MGADPLGLAFLVAECSQAFSCDASVFKLNLSLYFEPLKMIFIV